MSLNQLIELTRRSFRTSSAAMNVTGQNIANETTEGYTRRRITFQAETAGPSALQFAPLAGAFNGIGVSIHDLDRVRDQMLTAAGWEAQGGLGASEEQARVLSTIESLLPTDGTGALASVLNDFWNAWSDLSDFPPDTTARQALHARAETLALSFNRISQDLDRTRENVTLDLEQAVQEFNTKIQEIADLNGRIRAGRADSTPDLVAEDQRDQLIREVGKLAPIQVTFDAHNGAMVTVNGMMVVQETESEPLVLNTLPMPPTLTFQTTTVPFAPPTGEDGRIGALMRALTTHIPNTEQTLDDLAASIVDRINTLHLAGFGLDGGTGRNFFDPAGITAGTIAVSTDIANVQFIAASDNPDPTVDGNNAIALAILAERNAQQAALGNDTFEEHAIGMITAIGTEVNNANNQFEGHAAVLNYVDALERGASGVSMDEELTNLIRYQQSFQAAARVLSTAQVMYDTILSL